MRRRRWNWLAQVFRRGGENDCETALDWRPKGRRATEKTKDGFEKDCRERTRQDRLDELGQNGGTKQSGLERKRDGLMRLPARRDMMVK